MHCFPIASISCSINDRVVWKILMSPIISKTVIQQTKPCDQNILLRLWEELDYPPTSLGRISLSLNVSGKYWTILQRVWEELDYPPTSLVRMGNFSTF
ncbi:hypothetical protein AVEN_178568-1 [Araneus ventricosus]|uniref:Uncharacterized protein n=1 Tax=Araneus ventricosus TaxID=182803 RepID=A0A4Y2FJA6_ARAVE|nr:hypothetical protein AVEN_178568-1 [Araneus ventricosus]